MIINLMNSSKIGIFSWLIFVFLICVNIGLAQSPKKISREELRDKISGYWIGQLVGNYMGFPFEGTYLEDPVPIFVDRYYSFRDDSALVINRRDLRGYCEIMTHWFGGAFSDDDTDIEFVTLHAVEKHGLDINYLEITEMWKKHINRNIWCANWTARSLMSKGLVPPATGSKTNNENWYQIDPQLVNEIWSIFYPGMLQKSVDRAEWGARITNDDWGTHATIAYSAMFSAAVFEKDVYKLVDLALDYIPDDSPHEEGIRDVIAWHKRHQDWRVCRKLIFEKYYSYIKNGENFPVSDVSSLTNGLFGIMAILYGAGDFVNTAGIAVSAGLDCDNQAATCAGLVGVIHGASSIPDWFTLGLSGTAIWKKPFNDSYFNFTRDDLPIHNSISEIVERILAVAKQGIIEGGGEVIEEGEKTFYIINSDY